MNLVAIYQMIFLLPMKYYTNDNFSVFKNFFIFIVVAHGMYWLNYETFCRGKKNHA